LDNAIAPTKFVRRRRGCSFLERVRVARDTFIRAERAVRVLGSFIERVKKALGAA
jgi:hypothetical protein